jgi:hypothetical protein
MRRINKLHVGLAVSILLFLLLGYWIVKPDAAQDKPPYLSFSADVDGVKAWRELLSGKIDHVKEWRLGWDRLPQSTKQLLVAVQPDMSTSEDQDAILSWAERGNDVIVFDQQPLEWENHFPLVDSKVAKQPTAVNTAHTITRSNETDKAAFQGTVDSGYRLMPDSDLQGIFADEEGLLAGKRKVGQGSITMVLTPNWVTNGEILKNSHFELIWPLFGGDWAAIWIDETHHGYGTSSGLASVYPAWLKLAGVELALALLAWLWLRGKRFGPVYTPRAWTVRRGDETLLAAGGWYERLGYRGEALAHQRLHLRQLLFERWGLSPSATIEQARDAARARLPEAQVHQLSRLLEDSPSAQSGVSTKAFVERTREMGELIAIIEKE